MQHNLMEILITSWNVKDESLNVIPYLRSESSQISGNNILLHLLLHQWTPVVDLSSYICVILMAVRPVCHWELFLSPPPFSHWFGKILNLTLMADKRHGRNGGVFQLLGQGGWSGVVSVSRKTVIVGHVLNPIKNLLKMADHRQTAVPPPWQSFKGSD